MLELLQRGRLCVQLNARRCRDRGAAQARPGRAHSGRLGLRHDPLEKLVDHFPDYGLTFGNPDFVKYAEAYGARGLRATATEYLILDARTGLHGGGVCGGGSDRLFREHARADRRAEKPRAGA